jgi:deoxyribonuclease V
MNCCLDVDYRADHAIAACLLFAEWSDGTPTQELVARIDQIEPYVPGQFYRRELPCLLAVLAKASTPPTLIVVDGYVWLDEAGKPGLGAHLYAALGEQIPVIGVAKKPFHSAAAEEVRRAGADKPLYVTAVGVAPPEAAVAIAGMHGAYRIPTLLKQVDHLCRRANLL